MQSMKFILIFSGIKYERIFIIYNVASFISIILFSWGNSMLNLFIQAIEVIFLVIILQYIGSI